MTLGDVIYTVILVSLLPSRHVICVCLQLTSHLPIFDPTCFNLTRR